MAKGFAGTVFLSTDDVQADFEELGPRRRVLGGARGAPLRDRPSGSAIRRATTSGSVKLNAVGTAVA